MAVGLLGCRSLLVLIRTPAELMADSAEYLDIYTLGLPFLFLYNVATGIFTALGDSRTPVPVSGGLLYRKHRGGCAVCGCL